MPKEEYKPDIDPELVHKLAQLLDETGLTEIEYGTQTWHLRVSRAAASHAASVVAAVPSAAVAESPKADAEAAEDDPLNHPGLVTSPMVGVVYTLPEPDSPPLIKVGDEVKVKLIGIDDRGKVKLSMKVVDQESGKDLTKEPATESAAS